VQSVNEDITTIFEMSTFTLASGITF